MKLDKIFRRPNNDDDENDNDFFEGPDLPDPAVKEKKPQLKPDNPKYWDQEEGEFEHLKPRRSIGWLWMLATVFVAGLFLAVWLRYFQPCTDEASTYGYVERIEKKGLIFKTYEGCLIPFKEIMDETRIYDRDFYFSAANAEVAASLKKFENEHVPVRVEYKEYNASVPWRGGARKVIVKVDSVDPGKILQPAFQPEYIKKNFTSTEQP